MKPTSQIETITPTQAIKMLERNVKNRPITESNLASLVKEFQTGNFHFTGESIKFSEEGNLLDGQHRLLALAKSGKTEKFLVVRGLPNDSFKYMDTGRTRAASDVLSIEGVKNAAAISIMVKFIILFNKGVYTSNHRQNRGSNKITNAQVSEFVAKKGKSLADSYGFGHGRGKRIISGATIASMHYILKAISEKDADDFINKLVEGTNLTKGSPISLLRERFIIDSRSKYKMKPIEKIALIIKTWNLFRTDKKVSRLVWSDVNEKFPKAV